jgi:nicotinamide mononucleotide (NMN) deamidase PncC
MVRDELIGYLGRRFRTRTHISSLTVRFVGIGQSAIDQALKDHSLVSRDVILSSQFELGRVDFTFSLPSDTAEARSRLESLKQGILKYLGDYVYATDGTSLEETVIQLLHARGLSLTLVEIGSGGSLAAALNGAAAARTVVAGAFAAPTEERMASLLHIPAESLARATSGPERAEELAATASTLTKSDWVVVVGDVERSAGSQAGVQVFYRRPGERPATQAVVLRGSADQAYFTMTTQILGYMLRLLR